MLPEALMMGVSEEEFWELTPRMFKIHGEVYQRKLKEQDRFNWQLGAYFMNAVSVSLDHALNGHKARTEYFEKPFSEQGEDEYIDASNYSEEEKEALCMQLFGYLGDLQKTHEEAERRKKEVQAV